MKGLTYRYKLTDYENLVACLANVTPDNPVVWVCMNGKVCGDIDANRLIIEMNRMNNLHRQVIKEEE